MTVPRRWLTDPALWLAGRVVALRDKPIPGLQVRIPEKLGQWESFPQIGKRGRTDSAVQASMGSP